MADPTFNDNDPSGKSEDEHGANGDRAERCRRHASRQLRKRLIPVGGAGAARPVGEASVLNRNPLQGSTEAEPAHHDPQV
jgi:hypothetical protein